MRGANDGDVNDASIGTRLKLTRARKHLAELEAGAKAYLQSKPFEVYTAADPTSGPISYRVRVRADPPAELGVVLGDALHNARSALDHVVCRLVEHAGGQVVTKTAFPAGRTEKMFKTAVRAKLEGASAEALSAVEALAVHPGGDEVLWSLHQLDIDDKHKVLIPVGMYSKGVTLHMRSHDVEFPPLTLSANEVIPVTEGVEIFSVAEQARFAEPSPHVQDYSFPFDLALIGVSWAPAKPVPAVQAATSMIDRAEVVATELAELLR